MNPSGGRNIQKYNIVNEEQSPKQNTFLFLNPEIKILFLFNLCSKYIYSKYSEKRRRRKRGGRKKNYQKHLSFVFVVVIFIVFFFLFCFLM